MPDFTLPKGVPPLPRTVPGPAPLTQVPADHDGLQWKRHLSLVTAGDVIAACCMASGSMQTIQCASQDATVM